MNSKFSGGFLKTIIIISILPLVPVFLLSLAPAGLLLVGIIAYLTIAPFRRGVNSVFSGIGGLFSGVFSGAFKLIGGVFTGIFRLLGAILKGFGFSLSWLAGMKTSPSRFMGWVERSWLLRGSNSGPLVDGKSARLSENAGYESILVQGGMGRGKSSTFVMPNLLNLPASKPSFVISDTSGEIYQNTSGYLASQGYHIRVLNLTNPAQSETYNPLAGATSPQAIADLAKTLVKSANGRGNGQGASDPFWEQSAEKLIRIMTQCLQNQPDPSVRNLANLRQLITGFDGHTAKKGKLGKIDQFVLNATQSDPSTFSAYQAFVHGNLKTIQAVLMTADVALDPIATPELASLTATNSIDFDELRQRPVALYVIVNQMQMDLYAFLLNMFYADLFRTLLKYPKNPGRPVWLFLDEFGHLQIPGFAVFATTARKYKVSYALFLQSLAQLEGRYGHHDARTIVEGLGSEIYLPGTSLETARNLEARLGRKGGAPLMPASEIIRMKENEALMLYSNRLPILLKTKRYYRRGDLRRRAKRPPAQLPQNILQHPKLIQL